MESIETEKEFKQLLKSLCVEKKMAKEAQKKFEDGGELPLKFHEKLKEVHTTAEPALKKLAEELKEAREQNGQLHEQLKKVRGELEQERAASALRVKEHTLELRQAQQHLAKKIKETTLMGDLIEQQKGQLAELQTAVKAHQMREKNLYEQTS